VEVGYAYKRFGHGSRKLSGIKIVLSPGTHERQLLFEATALEMVPFRRRRPTDVHEPEVNPQHSQAAGDWRKKPQSLFASIQCHQQ